MKCGVVFHPTNWTDWERFLAQRWDEPPELPDYTIWDKVLHLVEVVDQVGFDRIWTTEHRSSPYGLIPNPLQFLTFVAGRTKNVNVGTQVIVIPWWSNPVRAAEEIALLDVFLQGRDLTVGLGRGVAPREFTAMGIDRNESRGRFKEGIELVRLALSQEHFSFDGEFFQIAEASVRPHPRNRQALVDGMVGAFAGPESLETIAGLGLGMINLAGGRSYDLLSADVTEFNRIRGDIGLSPMQPIIQLICYCAETEEKADDADAWFNSFVEEIDIHYEFKDASRFEGVKGYEAYRDAARQGAASRFEGRDSLLVKGTPDEVLARLRLIQEKTSAREFVLNMLLPNQPAERAEESIRLFAKEVLPALDEMETPLHEEHALAIA